MATPSIQLIPSAVKAGTVYSILPTNGIGDFDFTRASTATRINSQGLIETVASNVPRLDYSNGDCPSLLLEPQSTNLYLNSENLASQNVSTSASTYTVSFYGNGTITFSGTYAGSLVGTGENNRVVLTFTATAGTLINTVSGTVDDAQCENLDFVTSYIPTSGTTQTRVAETLGGAGDASSINSEEGVLYAEMSALADDRSNSGAVSISDTTTNNRFVIQNSGAVDSKLNIIGVVNGVLEFNITSQIIDVTNYNKIALKYETNSVKLFVNGILEGTDLTVSMPSVNTFNFLGFTNGTTTGGFRLGFVKDLRVYKTALTDAELQALTTQ